MKCYFTYFKLRFINGLQYRSAAIASVFTQLFFGMFYIMSYSAFYDSGIKNAPIDIGQVTTYVWLCQLFFSVFALFYKDKELFNLIRTGNLSYELARPKNLYFMWFFKILGQRLASLALIILPFLVFIFLLPSSYSMSPPISLMSFLLFIVSLIFGLLLMASLIVLYPIITIKTLNEKGFVAIFIVFADLLSGIGIPIVFFPDILQKVSSFLPFQYISDLPFRIYIGNIGIMDGLFGIAIQIFWIIILVFLGNLILKRLLNNVVIQGG